MSQVIRVNTSDLATPAVQAYLARLGNPVRVHENMGRAVQKLVREHVRAWEATHHRTADELGAKYSGFVGRAVKDLGQKAALTWSENSAILHLFHAFFARAFGEVVILPRKAKMLAIPLVAAAYNKQPRAFPPGFFFIPKKRKDSTNYKPVLCHANADGTVTGYYLLVPKVVQAQQRERLPDDGSLLKAALQALIDFITTTPSAAPAGGAA